jgi:apolipoprotein N-acyltransferase
MNGCKPSILPGEKAGLLWDQAPEESDTVLPPHREPERQKAEGRRQNGRSTLDVQRWTRGAARPYLPKPQSAIGLAFGGVTAFHLAYAAPWLSGCILLFLYCLVRLVDLRTARQAFYTGLIVGLACYAPHLAFFATIFGPAAAALWLVLAFWLGSFLLLAQRVRARWGKTAAALLLPLLWTGFEYFRSELYYLRFSWLGIGFSFAEVAEGCWMLGIGSYGVGLVLAGIAGFCWLLPRRLAGGILLGSVGLLALPPSASVEPAPMPPTGAVRVVGLQLEFPDESLLLQHLELVARKHPQAELVVLSEYTLQRPPPAELRAWCQVHRKHLVVGGKDPISDSQFYNTVFVIDPQGEIVFRQAKSVPIQFFQDGLPAPAQGLWESPWGKIGFAVCYDLSYRRVMDRLIEQGAEALIVPTADETSWGAYEHRLHGRVARLRAAEYGVPILRVAGSGISQLVDARGRLVASAPFPGQGETLVGVLRLCGPGRLPIDRFLAPAAAVAVGGLILVLVGSAVRDRARRTPAVERRS